VKTKKKTDNNRDIPDPEQLRITNIPVVVRFFFGFCVVQGMGQSRGQYLYVAHDPVYIT
jgi:hypothetical protein